MTNAIDSSLGSVAAQYDIATSSQLITYNNNNGVHGVGIGTRTPAYTLDVNVTIRATGTVLSATLSNSGNVQVGGALSVAGTSTVNALSVVGNSSPSYAVPNCGSILATSNLFLGTPGSVFIGGNGAAFLQLSANGPIPSRILASSDPNKWLWSTATICAAAPTGNNGWGWCDLSMTMSNLSGQYEYMHVTSGGYGGTIGNVGFGMCNPQYPVDVAGTIHTNSNLLVSGTSNQMYPPAALSTTNTMTSLSNLSYGNGVYITSCSDPLASWSSSEHAFLNAVSSVTYYFQTSGGYSTTSPYSATTSTVTVDSSGNTYNGTWLQIQLPNAIVPSSFYINSSTGGGVFTPNSYSMLGSKDGTNWTNLVSVAGSSSAFTGATFAITSTVAYQYYRFVCTKLGGNAGIMIINQINVYGAPAPLVALATGQTGHGVTNPVQTLEVAGNAMIYGNISAGNLGMFRNRIINGDMRINQRGVASGTVSGSTYSSPPGFFAQDRFAVQASISTGSLTVANNTLTSSDTPYQSGIQNSFRITALTACATYTYIVPTTAVEGYNIADFNWGTSFGVSATVSFWIRTNLAASSTISVILRNDALTYSFGSVVSVVGPNVWQYVTIVVPPPPAGSVWNTTNGRGIYFAIGTFGTTPGAAGWQNANYNCVSSTTNWQATAGNFVEFTGVQLEKGTIATPFEFRPYALELQLCQRYYWQMNSASSDGTYAPFGMAVANAPTDLELFINFPVAMRANPTASCGTMNSTNYVGIGFGGTITGSGGNTNVSTTNCRFSIACTGATPGSALMLRGNSASAYFAMSAEL